MSLRTTLTCETCPEELSAGGIDAVEEVLAKARWDGWLLDEEFGSHWCPDCAAERREESS